MVRQQNSVLAPAAHLPISLKSCSSKLSKAGCKNHWPRPDKLRHCFGPLVGLVTTNAFNIRHFQVCCYHWWPQQACSNIQPFCFRFLIQTQSERQTGLNQLKVLGRDNSFCFITAITWHNCKQLLMLWTCWVKSGFRKILHIINSILSNHFFMSRVVAQIQVLLVYYH